MERFILLAERRSGTTLMIDYLNNHPRIWCEKRAFGLEKKIANPTPDHHPGGFFLYRTASLGRRLRYWFRREALIAEFLEREVLVPEGERDIRGVRLTYNAHDRYPQVLQWARRNRIKVLHLIRDNILQTYISHSTAPLHRMHHPRKGDRIKTVKLTVDIPHMLRSLAYRERRIEKMRELVADLPHLEIHYEDLTADKDREAARVLPFLGAEMGPGFESDLVKINPNRLADVVANPDEVVAALRGTPYEKYLY